MSSRKEELKEKERKVREFLEENNFEGLLITKQNNFSWFTCGGDNHVEAGSEVGASSILITKSDKYVITTNIETPRIMDEEVRELGFEFQPYYWYEDRKTEVIDSIMKGSALASDTPFPGAELVDGRMDYLRYSLTEQELERYRWLGSTAVECMERVCKELQVGETEHQIAARLGKALRDEGITFTVLLVATDGRIFKYRHPIPTDKKLEKFAMVVTMARKWGLQVAITRLVHFGKLPGEIADKHQALVKIDATFTANTRPGIKAAAVLQKGIEAYAEAGYPDEWKLHHQGGPTGYKSREYIATPSCPHIIQPNQSFAWNPSITGTKSEDTIVAKEEGPELITVPTDWPMIRIKIGEREFEEPDILIR